MRDNSPTDDFVEDINKRILPFIDYSELDKSYGTDMSYAKGVLRLLHEAMVKNYGGEILDDGDGDDGFVIIPGVIQDINSGKQCVVLLELDLSSSGEHWGTTFLCKYGVIKQGENMDTPAPKRINAEFLPYDYGYTAKIPNDIHVDKSKLSDALQSALKDFGNHRLSLTDGKFRAEKQSALEQIRKAVKMPKESGKINRRVKKPSVKYRRRGHELF